MKILSIDPGKQGAFAISEYDSSGLVNIEFMTMPLLKNGDFDIRKMNSAFVWDYDLILIEDVHSVYGSSSKSNFVFGFGVGLVRALAEISLKPYVLVPPKVWQKEAWQGIKKVKNPKLNSLTAAHRIFPNTDFTKSERATKPHDGMVDAALIGYYGFVKYRK